MSPSGRPSATKRRISVSRDVNRDSRPLRSLDTALRLLSITGRSSISVDPPACRSKTAFGILALAASSARQDPARDEKDVVKPSSRHQDWAWNDQELVKA